MAQNLSLNLQEKLGDHTFTDDQGHEMNFMDMLADADFTILFFYPKDDTSGCTIENQDFQSLKGEFENLGAQLVGVSADGVKSHQKFKNKYELEHRLIADEERVIIEAFEVWVEKKMYGKTFMGIQRDTWILDKKGEALFHWPKVSPKTHAQQVLEKLKELQG